MKHPMIILCLGTTVVLLNAAPASWGQVINEDRKLLASDGAADDLFGGSVAVDNGVVAVGARLHDDNGINSGSAYLFDASTGAQIVELLPSDGASSDEVGSSGAIDNGIVAVGAHWDSDNGVYSGSAYLFDASNGVQIVKLLADDGVERVDFGRSIAIYNSVVAVGARYTDDNGGDSGSAYLFDAPTGDQTAKLLPNDGSEGHEFGISIAIDNGIVAVGAYRDDDNGGWSGSAYLFDESIGEQIVKLLPDDGAAEDLFGQSIAIDNGVVAVGAPWDDDNGLYSGSAYLFDASTGAQIVKLVPSDGAEWDTFGSSIAIDNGVVAVGASGGGDNGSRSGSAYLFDASSGVQIAKLLPSDGAEGDQFGISIAIDNGIVVVGARKDDDNGDKSGSAYVFDVGSNGNCLDLTVENLIAGKRATFTLSGGTPDAKAVTVYGTKRGEVSAKNYAGYCATFGIGGVTQYRVIGGFNRRFDGNGEKTFRLSIPGNLAGQKLFFQSAEHGTCPDECMSNLVEMVVG